MMEFKDYALKRQHEFSLKQQRENANLRVNLFKKH